MHAFFSKWKITSTKVEGGSLSPSPLSCSYRALRVASCALGRTKAAPDGAADQRWWRGGVGLCRVGCSLGSIPVV
jgi:hypothetical protein